MLRNLPTSVRWLSVFNNKLYTVERLIFTDLCAKCRKRMRCKGMSLLVSSHASFVKPLEVFGLKKLMPSVNVVPQTER